MLRFNLTRLTAWMTFCLGVNEVFLTEATDLFERAFRRFFLLFLDFFEDLACLEILEDFDLFLLEVLA